MRQAILGPASEMWDNEPERARSLFSSWMSGKPEVVQLRNSMSSQLMGQRQCFVPQEFSPCRLRHVSEFEISPPLAADEMYVGNGVEGSEYFVASHWCNPCSGCNFFKDDDSEDPIISPST